MEKADDFKKMISDVVDVAFDEMEATPNDMAKILFQLVWEEMASGFDTKEGTFQCLAGILFSVAVSAKDK
jgi:hypothetical protein